MFYFKTKLSESKQHGIGIFADEKIPKGALIWSPSPALSLHFTEDEFNKLPEADRNVISHYGYFHKQFNIWHLAADDSRYVNHSNNPTSTVSEDGWGLAALIDIQPGVEITQNYADFETESDMKKRGLL